MSSVYFLIGKTLGKYEILEHIGHGGMSEVYKGQQTHLERPVAVKVLHPFLADEKGFVTRFQREARIVATLRHPNIVQVFDFDFNEELGIYYMVMEYIDGPTLKSELENGPLGLEKSMLVGIAIANALDYAHKRDMVHRDVKPANIMFLDGTQPVLTDFGIAKMLTLSGLTASGAMVGTPAYIAPEVGIGKAGTAASDVYSLGVVLYQAVTGQLPFTSETPMGMVMQHINDAPSRPSMHMPDIPPKLEAVIMRALEKQPDNRYRNARAMALDITGILSPVTSQIHQSSSSLGEATDDDMWQVLNELEGSSLFDDNESRRVYPDDSSADLPVMETAQTQASILPAVEPTPKIGDLSTNTDTFSDRKEYRKARRKARVRRWRPVLAALALILVLAATVWSNFIGLIRLPAVWLPVMPSEEITIMAPDITDKPTMIAPTATPAPDTATPEVTMATTATPVPVIIEQPTATSVCIPRMGKSDIDIEPGETVWPQANMVARINMINSGKCTWPDELSLDYVGGQQVGLLDSHLLEAISPGQTLHLVIPFTAPGETGTYTSTWQVRRNDGQDFGPVLRIAYAVEDIDAPDPTPLPELTISEVIEEPLILEPPVITEFLFSNNSLTWQATYTVAASGGNGTYKYFVNTISAETELNETRFTVTAKRCEAAPVTLWILSGEDMLKWESELPFPDPSLCN